jgi:cyclopropane fatty-acyl-phospholipid synthase-like methyltransferase
MVQTGRFAEAKTYVLGAEPPVGSVGESYFVLGLLQLELLRMNECGQDSHVLEIGCGALVAGRPIIQFLKPDRYVGIEPNTWLIEAAKEGLPDTARLFAEKRPILLDNTDFDASSTGRAFDFVISHSVLSHVAAWQYPEFLENVRKSLAPCGVVLASIRFTDHAHRPLGDSNHQEWQYPGISTFSWDTARRLAVECGYDIEWRRDYREFLTRWAPNSFHDWIRLTRRG